MIDFQSKMEDAFLNMFYTLIDSTIIVTAPLFIIAVFAFIFRNYIALYYDLTWQKRDKLFLQSLVFTLLFGIPVVIYLVKHQHIFFLSLLTSVILTYILYIVGIVDMMIDKIERNRW